MTKWAKNQSYLTLSLWLYCDFFDKFLFHIENFHAKTLKMNYTKCQYNNSIHRYSQKCWKIAFHGFLEIGKIGKTGESSKSYFPAYLWISFHKIIVRSPSTYTPHFKGFGIRNLLYEIRGCKKAIIKSQWQFMCGLYFYESDSSY